MESTNTQARLEMLERDVQHDHRRRRRGTVAATLAVAASVAVAAFLVGTLSDDSRSTEEPAGRPGEGGSTLVATRFVDRLAAYDYEGMTTYLAKDAEVTLSFPTRDRDELLGQVLWSSAAGFRIVSRECGAEAGSTVGSVVVCRLEYHALGSEQLGLGPYGGATFRITIDEGSIVSAVLTNPYETNGFQDETWDRFAYWVATKHEEDGPLMYVDWPDFSRAAMDARSTELWAEHLQAFVEQFGEPCDCPL